MELQIQDLVSSIRKEGIEAANAEAESIIAEAKKKAESIVAGAKSEAYICICIFISSLDGRGMNGSHALRLSSPITRHSLSSQRANTSI